MNTAARLKIDKGDQKAYLIQVLDIFIADIRREMLVYRLFANELKIKLAIQVLKRTKVITINLTCVEAAILNEIVDITLESLNTIDNPMQAWDRWFMRALRKATNMDSHFDAGTPLLTNLVPKPTKKLKK